DLRLERSDGAGHELCADAFHWFVELERQRRWRGRHDDQIPRREVPVKISPDPPAALQLYRGDAAAICNDAAFDTAIARKLLRRRKCRPGRNVNLPPVDRIPSWTAGN